MVPTRTTLFLISCLATLLWVPAPVDAAPNLRVYRRQDTTEPPPSVSLPPTPPPVTTPPPPPVTTPLPPTTPPPPPLTTQPGPTTEPVTTTTSPPSPPPSPVISTTLPPTDTVVTSDADVTTATTGVTVTDTSTIVTDTTTITGTDITVTEPTITDTTALNGTETVTSTGTATDSTGLPVQSSTGSSGTESTSITETPNVTGTDTTTATDGPITPPPPPPRTDTVTGDGITTTYVPSIPPAAPSLSQGRETIANSSVAADDPQVQLTSGNWEPAPIPPVPKCAGSGAGSANATVRRATQVGSKIEYSFVGTAIYLNTVVGPGGGVFTATIDGNRADVDTHRALTSSTCEVTWSMWGLRNAEHHVVIEFRGASTDTDNTNDAGVSIANFVVTTDDSNAGSRAWASSTMSTIVAAFAVFFLFA